MISLAIKAHGGALGGSDLQYSGIQVGLAPALVPGSGWQGKDETVVGTCLLSWSVNQLRASLYRRTS